MVKKSNLADPLSHEATEGTALARAPEAPRLAEAIGEAQVGGGGDARGRKQCHVIARRDVLR